MSIRNLSCLTNPSSVALIGASGRPFTVGEMITRNLLDSGFSGPVYLVNPHHECVAGRECYPDVKSIPGVADLVVIATPRESVPGLID